MNLRAIWLILLVGCQLWTKPLFGSAEPISFTSPWMLTEDEPADWARNPNLVQPEALTGWRVYAEPTVPPGINKTIWLQNQLPLIAGEHSVLYFANGLEDIAVYIDGVLVYDYGLFGKSWVDVSAQRWHVIPLGAEHSHRRLQIRTHYALSYVVRTLYPVIRPHAEVLAEHTSRSFPLVYLAGWFGLLGFMVLAIALMRRQIDLFLYFGLMAVSVSSWVLFNQDSLIKAYTGLPPRSWSYFDLIGIYLSGACLISFLSIVAQSKSRVIRWVFWMNWGMALTVGAASGFGLIHAWYLLPLLHIAVFPSLLTLIPLIIWSAVQRNAEARILMIGSVAMGLSAIHDIVRYSSNFKSPVTTLIPFGGVVMLMAMLFILVRRYQAERDAAFRTQAKLLADIQGLNAELQKHVMKVEALVEEKTREIVSMLGHIQQGIFMLTGPDLQIHPEYSQHLETILDSKGLAHQSFQRVFLDRCRLGDDQRSRMLAALDSSLGETIFNFEVNASNLPTEVYLSYGNHEKILELSWAPIANDKDVTDKILVTARDVTGVRQLQLAARQSQEEMQLLRIILAAKPERFARFLDASLQLLDKARFAVIDSDEQGLKNVFRDLHTMKGNARSYELNELASLVHNAEQLLQDSLHTGLGRLTEDMKPLIERIRSKVESYKEIFLKCFRMNVGTDLVTIDRNSLERIFTEKSNRLSRLEELLLPQTFTSAEALFRELTQQLEKLAIDLDKAAPEFTIEGDGIHLTHGTAELLTDCLGHLLRNAMDHGIELPAERRALGKLPQGHLSILCRCDDQQLYIRFSDDGRGLNLQKIRDRACERGMLGLDDVLTENLVEKFIFSAGFSTKTEASLVSGRGIGLDAVRSALEQKGGKIRLCFVNKAKSDDSRPFYFELALPLGSFVESKGPVDPVKANRAS